MTKRKPKNVASEVPKKVPKRAKNHRTRSNPFEKADEEEYIVRKIDGSMYSKERGGWCYYTYWENFTDAEATWEPLENLVNCGPHLRAFKEKKKLEAKQDLEKAELRGIDSCLHVRICDMHDTVAYMYTLMLCVPQLTRSRQRRRLQSRLPRMLHRRLLHKSLRLMGLMGLRQLLAVASAQTSGAARASRFTKGKLQLCFRLSTSPWTSPSASTVV